MSALATVSRRRKLLAMAIRRENDHVIVEELPKERVLVVTRKATPLSSGDELPKSIRSLIEPILPGRRKWGIVFDARAAIGRNDPKFEAAMDEFQHWVEKHFDRVVLVVATSTGQLQMQRSKREGTWAHATVTRDFDEAVRMASVSEAR
jgi:hypothetical protein